MRPIAAAITPAIDMPVSEIERALVSSDDERSDDDSDLPAAAPVGTLPESALLATTNITVGRAAPVHAVARVTRANARVPTAAEAALFASSSDEEGDGGSSNSPGAGIRRG